MHVTNQAGASAMAAADDYWESFGARRVKEAHKTLDTISVVLDFESEGRSSPP